MRLNSFCAVVTIVIQAVSSDQSPWDKHSSRVCQDPSNDPLEVCPPNTVLVGPNHQYATIQSAVLSLPDDTSPQTLLMLPGRYQEQVNVTRKGPLTLLGQTSAPDDLGSNTVEILWRAVAGTGNNGFTAVLTVAPDLNASLTGSSPTGFPVPVD